MARMAALVCVALCGLSLHLPSRGYDLHSALELCESRGGHPGLPSLISLRFLWMYSNTSAAMISWCHREHCNGPSCLWANLCTHTHTHTPPPHHHQTQQQQTKTKATNSASTQRTTTTQGRKVAAPYSFW